MSDTFLRDVIGGVTCGIISIFFGLSFAAVIFSGPLHPWLGQGIAITFLTTAVAAAIFASRSSMKFAIAGPDSATTAVIAAFAAAYSDTLLRTGTAADALIGPVLFAMAVCSAFAGAVLLALGCARAGRAIRFIPYPVIGGFLGATGWLMTAGALRVIADIRIADLSVWTGDGTFWKVLAAAGLAGAIAVQRRVVRSVLAMPLLLTGAIIVFHVVRQRLGLSLDDVARAGWTFAAEGSLALATPPIASTASFPWESLIPHLGDILAVAFVTTVAMLLNTTGIEIAAKTEADLDNDLRTLGFANVTSAAIGGYISCVSLSRSTINNACGATGRLSGFTLAILAASMLFLNAGVLSYVPKFALGGLLLFSGVDLAIRWLVTSLRRLPFADYVSLVLIAIITVNWGFIAGVLAGIIIGCATFAVSASQVHAIKFSFSGTQYRSSLDRSIEELQILGLQGEELQGMSLQSYLFFGTTNRLYEHVKMLLASKSRCRFLLFDCRLVTGMDSSAPQSFAQIKMAAMASGARIVMANVPPEMQQHLTISGLIPSEIVLLPNLDAALEWCEDEIIAMHRRTSGASTTFVSWLGEALGGSDLAQHLARVCRYRRVAAGETIARQGEPSDSMQFILSGRVGILVSTPGGDIVRVRSLGALTTVGELGLIARQPRTAGIEAEVETELYELDEAAFETLMATEPVLGQALLRYVIKVLGERLAFANRAIGVLRR